MRIRTPGAVAIALGALFATSPAGAADKASEIIGAARKAIGEKKLDAVKTLSVNAAVQRNLGAMQLNSDTELLVELPDKYIRADTITGPMSGTSTMGFVGDKPLQTNAMGAGGGGLMIRMGPGPAVPGGAPPKLSPEEQEQADRMLLRSMKQDLSRLMLGWLVTAHPSLNAQYTYVGEAESPDGKAYVIEAKNDEGFSARVFIDEQTRLPLMVTYRAPQPRIITRGGPRDGASRAADGNAAQDPERQQPTMVDYALFFDDWRDVDGIKFPHRMRRAMSGETTEEWTVSKVKVNPKIDPKKFEG